MKPIIFPFGMRAERLARKHPRSKFQCGESRCRIGLTTKALQHQEKNLSVTKVLLDAAGNIAGYYTLATGQIDFGELPMDVRRNLPRRTLPIAVLAWFGIAADIRARAWAVGSWRTPRVSLGGQKDLRFRGHSSGLLERFGQDFISNGILRNFPGPVSSHSVREMLDTLTEGG